VALGGVSASSGGTVAVGAKCRRYYAGGYFAALSGGELHYLREWYFSTAPLNGANRSILSPAIGGAF